MELHIFQLSGQCVDGQIIGALSVLNGLIEVEKLDQLFLLSQGAYLRLQQILQTLLVHLNYKVSAQEMQPPFLLQ